LLKRIPVLLARFPALHFTAPLAALALLLGMTTAPGGAIDAPLRACGRALCQGDGSRFLWRGVTAFSLADLVADGKERDARAFLQWARDSGFTIVRVLAMMPDSWFQLTPADGRRALPRLFALARDHGLFVEIVALANTRGRDETFLREQVRAVGQACAAADNCVMEIANEPYHSSQARLTSDLMRRLQREVPERLLVAWGAASRDTSDDMAGGTFVTVHVARAGERFARVGRMQVLEAMSARTRKFVVDNEPIGAGERPEHSRRDDEPSVFFAQGLLSRVFDVGSNFHCQACLDAQPLGPVQQRAAKAFIAGATLVPDHVVLTVRDLSAADSPVRVQDIENRGASAFAGTAGNKGWLVVLGPRVASVPWQAGWRADRRVAEWPGVDVWTFVR
jgi:hypothetical protein